MTTASAAAARAAVAAGFGVTDGAREPVRWRERDRAPEPATHTAVGQVMSFCGRAGTLLSAADLSMPGSAFARLTAELDPEPGTMQALHGDAGRGNLMAAGSGWRWHDFVDTCSGPVTWDLAASTASRRMDRARILSAYDAPNVSKPRQRVRADQACHGARPGSGG